MNLTIHRGTNEIGGSCVEVSTEKTHILVDFGMPLVSPKDKKQKLDTRDFKKLKLSDLLKMGILPDIPGLYDPKESCDISAIVLSHPHQDHYGLLTYVRKDIPIYIGIYAKRLIDASDIFLPTKMGLKNTIPINPGEAFRLGADIKVTPYLMDHSAFESLSFLIEADGKRVFYSGDFRAHGRKSALFERFVKNPPKNVDKLLMEGTVLGSSSHESFTEDQIENKIIETANKYKGLKLIAASGQNIDRIVSFYRAAVRTNRYLVVDLYIAYVLHALGYEKIPHPGSTFKNMKILYTHNYAQKIVDVGGRDLLIKWNKEKVKPNEIAQNPGKYLLFYRKAFENTISKIKNFKDAVMIYSMYSGYRKEDSFKETQKFLDINGIKLESIHTSGHADIPALKRFAKAINPKKTIPIHTFHKEDYKQIFSNVLELEDGKTYLV